MTENYTRRSQHLLLAMFFGACWSATLIKPANACQLKSAVGRSLVQGFLWPATSHSPKCTTDGFYQHGYMNKKLSVMTKGGVLPRYAPFKNDHCNEICFSMRGQGANDGNLDIWIGATPGVPRKMFASYRKSKLTYVRKDDLIKNHHGRAFFTNFGHAVGAYEPYITFSNSKGIAACFILKNWKNEIGGLKPYHLISVRLETRTNGCP